VWDHTTLVLGARGGAYGSSSTVVKVTGSASGGGDKGHGERDVHGWEQMPWLIQKQ
jgi:hypothetical protein